MKFLSNLSLLIANGGVMLCCVLPAILVSLGLGSTLVTFLDNYPIFIEITKHKAYIFIGVFILLVINGVLIYRSQNQVCEIDEISKECDEVKSASKGIYIFSVIVYFISLYLSYGF